MAKSSISIDQDQFTCAVCLDFLKDPATLPCGHIFCEACIDQFWDQDNQKGIYSCPKCRETVPHKKMLNVNKTVTQVVSGDVECDFCTVRKQKAVKSCLMCVASFCEIHLKPHLERPALKKHTLTEASENLQEKICSEHDEVLKIYCRTDRTCICHLCMIDNHKGHETVTAAAERVEKQSELKAEQIISEQRIQEKHKKVQELKQAVKTIKLSAQTAVKETLRVFTEMIRSMEKKRSEVTEMIRDQEKAEVSRAERLVEQLEQEISDLQRRVNEMEQLSHTHDHIHFLQASGCRSPVKDRPDFETSSITVHQHLSFDGVKNCLSDLKKRLEEFCEEEFSKIHPHAVAIQIISPPEPESREDFLKYFCYLTLDPDTAYRKLVLSENNKVVRYIERDQPYFDHPERFDSWPQVLCKESVCGRCYWEVERSRDGCVDISVSYKDIRRKGQNKKYLFGRNNQSWSLWCSPSSLSFYHKDIKTDLKVPASSRIGVYVDHSAGILSFYSVSDRITLLHRVYTTFTQPLYAGFGPSWSFDSSVKLCDP